MYSFIELLRAIAVLLITNSHMDGVYPLNISWGGCPGVSLFFAITGFLLVRGVQTKFLPWWLKKVIRLYIPMTIVNIIMVLIGFRNPSVHLFLFPIDNPLWYVPAISLLYIPYYVVLNLDKKKGGGKIPGGLRGAAIAAAAAIYIAVYIINYRNEFFVEPDVWFKPLYGFIAMMLGSLVYDNREKLEASGRGALFITGSVLCCGGFLVTKLLVNRISFFMSIQFMTQVFSVAFAVLALCAGICCEKKLKGFMQTVPGKAFGLISCASLEIYLVQIAIIRYLRVFAFPINLLLIIAAIAVCAFAVHFVSVRLTKALTGVLFRKKQDAKK